MSCLISFERQSSCEEHGTSENNPNILFMVGCEPSHGRVSGIQLTSPHGKSRLLWIKELNIHAMLVIRSINKLEHNILTKYRINMVHIAVAVLPWYNICIIFQIDQCRYFITILINSHTLYDWNARQQTYCWSDTCTCSSLFIDRKDIQILQALHGHLTFSFITTEIGLVFKAVDF